MGILYRRLLLMSDKEYLNFTENIITTSTLDSKMAIFKDPNKEVLENLI